MLGSSGKVGASLKQNVTKYKGRWRITEACELNVTSSERRKPSGLCAATMRTRPGPSSHQHMEPTETSDFHGFLHVVVHVVLQCLKPPVLEEKNLSLKLVRTVESFRRLNRAATASNTKLYKEK